MGNIGLGELVVILLILLLVFGAKRLPEIGRSLGKTVNEFKKGMRDDSSDASDEADKKENNHVGQA